MRQSWPNFNVLYQCFPRTTEVHDKNARWDVQCSSGTGQSKPGMKKKRWDLGWANAKYSNNLDHWNIYCLFAVDKKPTGSRVPTDFSEVKSQRYRKHMFMVFTNRCNSHFPSSSQS